MSKFQYLLQSRKFWAALVGLVMVLVSSFVPDFPFESEEVLAFVVTVVSYILGTALEDGLAARK